MSRHKVPIFTQSTISLCWEAVARMMWAWKNMGLTGYKERAGSYLNAAGGLSETQMDEFYRALGMRSMAGVSSGNLTHALTFSPVAFVLREGGFGHALCATGSNGGSILINNPCSQQVVDFETDSASCSASEVALSSKKVDSNLGRFIWYW
jgi:hypothetical protein